MLYIQFQIKDTSKFEDFKKAYEVLRVIKPKEKGKPLSFWSKTIPEYAKEAFREYYKEDKTDRDIDSYGFRAIINYMEFGLEVDLDNLVELENDQARLEYTALAFPYGGMDRLLVFMIAYDLIPFESFDGFSVFEFTWISKFQYDGTNLEDKTKAYKAQFKR